MSWDYASVRWGRPVLHARSESEEMILRYVSIGSALISLLGAGVIFLSALRFKELSKRFFAIRLIIFLTITDTFAALIHAFGGILDVYELARDDALPTVCKIQSVALIYFNLASILWTSCFAYTLYRDIMRSHRRQALKMYEVYFHVICWPLAAVPAGVLAWYASGSEVSAEVESWCAMELTYTKEYLTCFHCPLTAALAFNLLIYVAVLRNSRERRASRTTSFYLLGFLIVWTPTLLSRLQFLLSSDEHVKPLFLLEVLEAICSPLQGALNAVVYGWSLPSIRDVYRKLLLGDDDPSHICSNGNDTHGHYSPPDIDVTQNNPLRPASWSTRSAVLPIMNMDNGVATDAAAEWRRN